MDAWLGDHGSAADGLALRGARLVASAAAKKGRKLALLNRSVLLSSDDTLLPENGLSFVAERFPDVVVPPFMLALNLLLHDASGDASPRASCRSRGRGGGRRWRRSSRGGWGSSAASAGSTTWRPR